MAAEAAKETQSKPKKEDPSDFTDIVGGCGAWQWQIFFLFFVASFPGVWHNLVMDFFAPDIDHWCARSDEAIAANISVSAWKKEMIPLRMTEDGDVKYNQCRQYGAKINVTRSLARNEGDGVYNTSYNSNETVSCRKWEYDESFYVSTVRAEWDLVCDRDWLVSITKSIYMAGFLVSVLVFGQISDKIGRRPVILMCVIILLSSGVICAFSISFIMFTVSRFFVALGASGIFTTAFVMLMEVVGSRHRSLFGVAIEFGWSTGFVLLPGIAWMIRDWFWLQLALTVPCVALLSLWWLVPESPRWLITQGKWEKAQEIMTHIAKKNGKEVNDMEGSLKKLYNKSMKAQGTEAETGNIFDLLRTPGLRMKTLNVYFNWFVNSFIYYGLSYNTGNLGGDPYINFLVSGAVEFPAYMITIIVIKKLGRRIPLMSTMVAGGIACILTIPVPDEMIWLRITFAMFGKFCITASFAIIYVYSAEIYPTVIRNVGVGSSSMIARIGSILAPFVKELGNATHPAVPLACFGGLSITSGLLVLLLPETNNCKVPDTVEEAAAFGRKPKRSKEHSMENGNGHIHDHAANGSALAVEATEDDPKSTGLSDSSQTEGEDAQDSSPCEDKPEQEEVSVDSAPAAAASEEMPEDHPPPVDTPAAQDDTDSPEETPSTNDYTPSTEDVTLSTEPEVTSEANTEENTEVSQQTPL